MTTFIIALLMALGFLSNPSDLNHLSTEQQEEMIQQIITEDANQM